MTEEKIRPLREIGSTGLERYNGIIYDEFLPQLKGDRSIKVYTEMSSNDAVVSAVLFAVTMMMRQVKWSATPASDDAEGLWGAEFLDSVLHDMSKSWEDTLEEIFSMLTYGWSYHEIVYKRRLGHLNDSRFRSKYNDGYIGWRKLPIRAQDTLYRWDFDESGGIRAMIQLAPPNYQPVKIPIEKALLFRTEVRKGNPEGRSILRNAYRSWYYKKRLEEIEAIGIERDLAGLPMAWVPPELLDPNATAEERAILQEIKQIVTNIRRDEQEGVVFPLQYDEDGNKLFDLELLNSGGRRQFDLDKTINRYDQRIAMTILADFILLGHERVGSYSLGSSKIDLFTTAISSWIDSVTAVFNRHAIPRLWRLNGFDMDTMPELAHSTIQVPNLKELSDYIDSLAGAGVPLFPDNELENYLRQVAGLPVREEG